MAMIVFVLIVMGFLLFGLLLEVLRFEYGLPITLVDLIFFPLTMVMCFFVLREVFRIGRRRCYVSEVEIKKPLVTLAGFSIIAIPFVVLVAWNVREGVIVPFGYFSLGRGGAVHGYTIMSFGAFLMMSWAFVFLKAAGKMIGDKVNKF